MPGFFFLFTMSILWLCICTVIPTRGAEYSRDGDILGKQSIYRIRNDESLPEVARKFDIGYTAMTAANPTVDPFVPDPGQTVIVPSEAILPDVSNESGVVVNIAEMRLYLLPSDQSRPVTTFPVGIGGQGKDTPVGSFTIIEKIRNPAWHVPKSILAEKPYLPAVVPPGPENPMGSRALRLSNKSVLIHGTDRPWGIGTRDSHGCIRLYEEDIARLFEQISLGASVTIVNQPVKATMKNGSVYIEIHDYADGRDLYKEALKVLEKKGLLGMVNLDVVKMVASERRGLVVPVTK